MGQKKRLLNVSPPRTLDDLAQRYRDWGQTERATGPLRGVRTFTIRDEPFDEAPWLAGWWGGTWSPGENVAGCRKPPTGGLRPPLWGKPHDAPDEACSCGFYAYHRIPRNPDFTWSFTTHIRRAEVVACVEAWGEVLIGDLGFRAERTRLVAIAPNWSAVTLEDRGTTVGRTFVQLADRYGVPATVDVPNLFYQFPLGRDAFGMPVDPYIDN